MEYSKKTSNCKLLLLDGYYTRLLRENCTVYVFSNYPCQQAELVQEKYLKDNMETLDYVESGSDTLEC